MVTTSHEAWGLPCRSPPAPSAAGFVIRWLMAWDHDKTSTERGYGWAWQKLRRRILMRDMHLCQPCLCAGNVTAATEVDHITPKAKGGTDDPDNLQAICGECHKAKTAEDEGRKTKPTIGLDGWPVR